MGLMDRLRSIFIPPITYGADPFWPYVTMNGVTYPLSFMNQTLTGTREDPDPSYGGLVAWAMAGDPVVFACMRRRMELFSEARFQWRRVRNGKPGELFGTAELGILERPWPNGTTGDLLARMMQDVDLAGNAFIARSGDRLVRLRPDWTSIVMGSTADPEATRWDLTSTVLGYVYQPGGAAGGRPAIVLDASEVAHFAPIPDPLSPYRGMSWLTPVLREIGADRMATEHKARFFENGATPSMVVAFDPTVSKETFDAYRKAFVEGHEGAANAYRTMFLGGGAKVEVVGKDFAQLDFKVTQGAGETRIAAAAGVPPAVVHLSEGLQGSSLNAGNFAASVRLFADMTVRPLWRNAAKSLETVAPPPGGAELWYDADGIAALKDDQVNFADIQTKQAAAIRQYVDAGFTPDSAVKSIDAGDLSLLVHTGLYSVQLQPPGSLEPPEPETPGPEPSEPETEEPDADEEPTASGNGRSHDPFAALITLAERRAEAAEARAEAAERREQHPPVVNVPVTIAEGAVQATFNAEPPVVNVTTPEVTVNTPEMRTEVHVEPTPVTIENAVSVEPTPVEVRNEVSVEPTPVSIVNDVSVEPTPVSITNEVTSPEVNVRAEMPAAMTMEITAMPAQSMEITSLPPQKRRVTERDDQGYIVKS